MRQFLLSLLILLCLVPSAGAEEKESKTFKPYFAALRPEEVNLRAGPGTTYPIAWVYHRSGLPVEVTAAFDIWRRIRDFEGSEGWVHKAMLRTDRNVITIGPKKQLHAKPDTAAPVRAVVGEGVIGEARLCEIDWCFLRVRGIKGWMKKTDVWGVRADETFKE